MQQYLQQYNVVWVSPSKDASGSMPIGNGDLGANVWVEQSGDLLLLIGKTDSWDENSINLKLGRIRIRLHPNPFKSDVRFRQELRLATADIVIEAGPVRIRIWADANQPIIHVEAEGDQPFEMEAALEMWRVQPYQVKTQTGDLFKNLSGPDPYPTIISPDHVLSRDDRVIWCHHNEPRQHDGYRINMERQGLGGMLDQIPHPLTGRTFGAAMLGEGFASVDERTLRCRSGTAHRLSICGLTLHPATVEQWQQEMDALIASVQRAVGEAREEHERWWEQFWDRSWIYVQSPDARDVTRGYILQRFMNACAGRGRSPIKFNGAIFTVGKPEDPDFRRWGGPGFWFMNQRLIYWPMLAAGDFDLMLPWLRIYRDMLPLQKHRTKTYYGHGGAHYPETIMFWGAEVSAHYGWTPFEQRKAPEAECPYITYYWSGGIELTLILLNYYLYTNDQTILREFLLPIADAVTEFYDLHYPRDPEGRIRFEPAQSLETWHEVTNPLPEIAGLQYTLSKLVETFRPTLPALCGRWTRMLDQLPKIPIAEGYERGTIKPAERFDRKKNTENPELYCVFPYRLYGVGKPRLELARDTFAVRLHPSHECWSQDDIQMALLGLTEQARQWITRRAAPDSHSESRFPAFWNAFHDWIPDMDHGGVLQLALQFMLMQCEGREIRLLPAWPADWEAHFKLRAPFQTIVEGHVRAGKLVELRVTPPSRQDDVIVCSAEPLRG